MAAETTLYVVPASHPCACVERALELKGIPFRRVDLLPVLHKALQRARFGQGTVPGIRFADGEKVVGSRAILRALDVRAPEPALLPPEPAARARVLEAEAWGDEVLQPLGRRVSWAALRRSPAAMPSYSEGASLPVPMRLAALSAGPVAFAETRINKASDSAARADLHALPGHLDKVDGWIADGVLGGARPNAADLQIGSGLRLLLTFEDIAPLIDARPAGELAAGQFPGLPGPDPGRHAAGPLAALIRRRLCS